MRRNAWSARDSKDRAKLFRPTKPVSRSADAFQPRGVRARGALDAREVLGAAPEAVPDVRRFASASRLRSSVPSRHSVERTDQHS